MAKANTKLVRRSDMAVGFSKNAFQMIVPAVPESNDAITPARETFFQKRTSRIAGPKDEPIPDQA